MNHLTVVDTPQTASSQRNIALRLAWRRIAIAVAVARGWPGFTLFGLSGGHVILLAFTLVVEALIVIAGITAHHEWSVLERQAGWRGTGFARWMAFAGMVLSGFFFVAVLYAGLPALVLQSCS